MKKPLRHIIVKLVEKIKRNIGGHKQSKMKHYGRERVPRNGMIC